MKVQKEKRTSRNIIYKGNVFNIYQDQVEFPNNHKSEREVVEHSGGVSVLAENKDNEILLIKQYRYPVDEVIYEIPAGKLEKGESPLQCAQRELREETGYKAENFSELFKFFPTPGYSTENIYIYKAQDLKHVGLDLDEGEYIELVPKSRSELKKLMARREIKDSKTLIALMHYLGDF